MSQPEALQASVSLLEALEAWMGCLSRLSLGCVSLGDSRGGQGALGEQLHLVAEALQPHHLVRAGGGGRRDALDIPTPSSLGSFTRNGPYTPHRRGGPLGMWDIPGPLRRWHHSPDLRYQPN